MIELIGLVLANLYLNFAINVWKNYPQSIYKNTIVNRLIFSIFWPILIFVKPLYFDLLQASERANLICDRELYVLIGDTNFGSFEYRGIYLYKENYLARLSSLLTNKSAFPKLIFSCEKRLSDKKRKKLKITILDYKKFEIEGETFLHVWFVDSPYRREIEILILKENNNQTLLQQLERVSKEEIPFLLFTGTFACSLESENYEIVWQSQKRTMYEEIEQLRAIKRFLRSPYRLPSILIEQLSLPVVKETLSSL